MFFLRPLVVAPVHLRLLFEGAEGGGNSEVQVVGSIARRPLERLGNAFPNIWQAVNAERKLRIGFAQADERLSVVANGNPIDEPERLRISRHVGNRERLKPDL